MPIVKIEFTKKDPSGSGLLRAPEALIANGPNFPIIVGPALAPGQTVITPQPTDQTVSALIDSGATDCCIDTRLAKQLALRVIDRCKVGGVAGRKDHDVYLGKLVVPALNLSMNGRLIGVSLTPQMPIILGRDFLANLIMIYDGVDGTITLTC